ncbi:MAG: DUF1957 domain-containing protein [Candidatus Lokiarchaeota archaeon]|nr:DUF1957 domain-containing protein [Candidatus Lokiarchaeota archaeon]
MAVIGHFTFVLHSHLPWVLNHGVWPHGTSWLNEAAAETYLPILDELYGLVDQGYTPSLTIGITPVLSEMMIQPRFKAEFKGYLHEKIDAARHDQEQFKKENFQNRLKMAKFWEDWYGNVTRLFEDKFHEDIPGAFRALQDRGIIEIITCGATHGYFALLPNDFSVDAQVRTAVESYKRIYGRKPRGIWLPECAYRPAYPWRNPVDPKAEVVSRKGVEYFLAKNDLEYFFVDTHLTMGGLAQGVYAARFKMLKDLWKQFMASYKPVGTIEGRTPYMPYLIHSPEPISPVAFFTREEKTGILVWSGEHGFPGDGNYLDFHKKHYPGGLRYWKVTGAKLDLGAKHEYYPADVPSRIDENASHYKNTIKGLLQEYHAKSGHPGIICAMYDCELFGHWWFEGVRFLAKVLKWIQDDPELELTTCGRYLDAFPPVHQISLPEGSWGQGGGHWIWLNEWTQWTWERIAECQRRVKEVADTYAGTDKPELKRICSQLAREELLLEASDWQFLISTWSARDYAEARVALHYENVIKLYEMAKTFGEGRNVPQGSWEYLGRLEAEDNLFADIDIGWWKGGQ